MEFDWQELVREPAGERHLVQIYRDAAFLESAVAAWAAAALERGGGAALIGTPEHRAAIMAAMNQSGLDTTAAQAEGRLVLVDARSLMARFMAGETPDATLLTPLLREVFAGIRSACGGNDADLRAWGEMVDLLRHDGQPEAAKQLETIWNTVIDEENIRLLCSYRLDNLSPEAHGQALGDICHGHSMLIPEADSQRFDLAVSQALVEVLGEDEAASTRSLLGRKRTLPIRMPAPQAVLVALQRERPDVGRRVLQATRRHLESGLF